MFIRPISKLLSLRGAIVAVSVAGLFALGVSSPAVAGTPVPPTTPDPAKLAIQAQSPTTNVGSIQINSGSTTAGVHPDATVDGPGELSGSFVLPDKLASTGFTSTVKGTDPVVSGNSYGRWLGTSPFEPTSNTLTDTIWATGIGVTAIEVPGGGSTWALFTSTATLKSKITGWDNTHTFGGLEFGGNVLTVNERSLAQIYVGSALYTAEAN